MYLSKIICKTVQSFKEGLNSEFSLRNAEILTGLGFWEAGH